MCSKFSFQFFVNIFYRQHCKIPSWRQYLSCSTDTEWIFGKSLLCCSILLWINPISQMSGSKLVGFGMKGKQFLHQSLVQFMCGRRGSVEYDICSLLHDQSTALQFTVVPSTAILFYYLLFECTEWIKNLLIPIPYRSCRNL